MDRADPLSPHIVGIQEVTLDFVMFVIVQDLLEHWLVRHICQVVSVFNFRWIFPTNLLGERVKEFPEGSKDKIQL